MRSVVRSHGPCPADFWTRGTPNVDDIKPERFHRRLLASTDLAGACDAFESFHREEDQARDRPVIRGRMDRGVFFFYREFKRFQHTHRGLDVVELDLPERKADALLLFFIVAAHLHADACYTPEPKDLPRLRFGIGPVARANLGLIKILWDVRPGHNARYWSVDSMRAVLRFTRRQHGSAPPTVYRKRSASVAMSLTPSLDPSDRVLPTVVDRPIVGASITPTSSSSGPTPFLPRRSSHHGLEDVVNPENMVVLTPPSLAFEAPQVHAVVAVMPNDSGVVMRPAVSTSRSISPRPLDMHLPSLTVPFGQVFWNPRSVRLHNDPDVPHTLHWKEFEDLLDANGVHVTDMFVVFGKLYINMLVATLLVPMNEFHDLFAKYAVPWMDAALNKIRDELNSKELTEAYIHHHACEVHRLFANHRLALYPPSMYENIRKMRRIFYERYDPLWNCEDVAYVFKDPVVAGLKGHVKSDTYPLKKNTLESSRRKSAVDRLVDAHEIILVAARVGNARTVDTTTATALTTCYRDWVPGNEMTDRIRTMQNNKFIFQNALDNMLPCGPPLVNHMIGHYLRSVYVSAEGPLMVPPDEYVAITQSPTTDEHDARLQKIRTTPVFFVVAHTDAPDRSALAHFLLVGVRERHSPRYFLVHFGASKPIISPGFLNKTETSTWPQTSIFVPRYDHSPCLVLFFLEKLFPDFKVFLHADDNTIHGQVTTLINNIQSAPYEISKRHLLFNINEKLDEKAAWFLWV